MKHTIQSLCEYIKEVLSIAVMPTAWSTSGHLQFFLKERYDFYQAVFLELPCLLLVDKGDNEQTPAIIRKHIDLVRPKADDCEIIYVRQQVTAYNRKRLVEQNVPFIVPGNQMYLPMLAIDFREHFRKIRSPSEKFRPSAQVVILHALCKNPGESMRAVDLARRYDYSLMTMSRALDEIEYAGIGEIAVVGRERRLSFTTGKRDLWEKAMVFLRTPVKKRVYIRLLKDSHPGPLAGLSALAGYSLLAEAKNPVYAMDAATWKVFRADRTVEVLPGDEPDACEIEIWSYDPRFFADKKMVDRFSLYLTLRDEKDERVETALKQMMKEMQW